MYTYACTYVQIYALLHILFLYLNRRYGYTYRNLHTYRNLIYTIYGVCVQGGQKVLEVIALGVMSVQHCISMLIPLTSIFKMVKITEFLLWRIPWTEKPGRLFFMGWQELDLT